MHSSSARLLLSIYATYHSYSRSDKFVFLSYDRVQCMCVVACRSQVTVRKYRYSRCHNVDTFWIVQVMMAILKKKQKQKKKKFFF